MPQRVGTVVRVTCEQCQRSFSTQRRYVKRGEGRFCSRSCASKAPRRRPDMSGSRNPAWKGGVSKSHYRYKKTQQKRFPERVRARDLVGLAIKKRRLQRQPCEKCGALPTQAHHDDYSQPLAVRWLCRACHREHHRHNDALP